MALSSVSSRVSLGGFSLATQTWRAAAAAPITVTKNRVLALHGWLDNSSTFSRLAPVLLESGAASEFVAVDLPGHGHSSHFDGPFQHARHVGLVKAMLDSLGWAQSETTILGHSMGGGISLLFAGCFPERLCKCVVIDAFGPYTSTPERAPVDLRKSIEAEERVSSSGGSSSGNNRKYATLGDAITARVKIVSTYPGSQSISREAAEDIVRRGAHLVDSGSLSDAAAVASWESTAGIDPTTWALAIPETLGPVAFRYDPRLLTPSATYLTVSQVDAFASSITAPVLLLQAQNGWPVPQDYAERKRILQSKGLLDHRVVEGSHHLHLDPATAPAVAATIAAFLLQK